MDYYIWFLANDLPFLEQAPHRMTDFPVRMLSELGFKKVAGSDVLFLPTMVLAKFPDISTEDFEMQAGVDYSADLEKLWKDASRTTSNSGPHPFDIP